MTALLNSIVKTSLTTSIPSQKLRIKNNETLNKKLSKSKNLTFLTTDARQAFTQLRQTFIETSIFSYFDSKRHIKIKTNVSSYTIRNILS